MTSIISGLTWEHGIILAALAVTLAIVCIAAWETRCIDDDARERAGAYASRYADGKHASLWPVQPDDAGPHQRASTCHGGGPQRIKSAVRQVEPDHADEDRRPGACGDRKIL